MNAVAGALTKADPTHAQSYAANGARTLQRLDKLDENLRMKLAQFTNGPSSSSTTPIGISSTATI